MSDKRKMLTYDSFRRYISDECRGRNHQKLSVAEYLKTTCNGNYLKIPLVQCDGADIEFFEKVESFREGTKLKIQENYQTGDPMYIANVPYGDPRKSKSKRRKHHHKQQDSVVTPLVWGMGLMATLTVAALTTTKEQWLALF